MRGKRSDVGDGDAREGAWRVFSKSKKSWKERWSRRELRGRKALKRSAYF